MGILSQRAEAGINPGEDMSTPEQLFFSIVVPTRDRPDSLERCLTSLAALAYPRDRYEVIVVDDGGTHSPASAMDRLSASMRLSLIKRPHAGPGTARNAGVATSRGEALAFIDDDCTADSNWLGALAARLRASPGAVIGGRVANALPRNPYSRASQTLIGYLYRYYHGERRGSLRFFTTNNVAVSARDFEHIGPFDASFPFAAEDREWCDRCLQLGHELVYAPEAVVHHAHHLTLQTFLRQHYRYGQGAIRFHRTRAHRRGEAVRLEPLSFYTGMLAAPFAGGDPQPVRASLLLLASQVVGAIGFAHALSMRSESQANRERL